MNWITAAADRAAGALQGARDAACRVTYEPLEGRSEATSRERAVYDRWQQFRPARNAYERDAYQSLPRELEAEMDRAYEMDCAEQWAREDEAERVTEDAEQDARDWEAARASWENEQEAGQ